MPLASSDIALRTQAGQQGSDRETPSHSQGSGCHGGYTQVASEGAERWGLLLSVGLGTVQAPSLVFVGRQPGPVLLANMVSLSKHWEANRSQQRRRPGEASLMRVTGLWTWVAVADGHPWA